MKRKYLRFHPHLVTEKGFSLIELVIIVAVIGILLAIATPSFLQWRNNQNYRQTARQITSMLREARSLTITNNIPHTVVFKPNSSSYSLLRNSSKIQGFISPAPVLIRGGSGGTSTGNISVMFNSNGTAVLSPSDGNISVQDGTNQKFLVTVTATGRISLQQKY